MIGKCDCKSSNRNPDGTWNDAIDMTWTFEYIMNGMAVQDNTLKVDGKHSGSLRMYSADSAQWYVHYYAEQGPSVAPLRYWTGNHQGDKIVLKMAQKSPQGVDGFSRLTFYEMNEKGYRWIGEWINSDETILYPFWKIDCTR